MSAHFLQLFACVWVGVGLSPRHSDGPASRVDLFLPVELLVALMLLLLSQTACVLLVAGGLHLEPARVLNEDMDVLFVFYLDLLAWLHLLTWMKMRGIVVEVNGFSGLEEGDGMLPELVMRKCCIVSVVCAVVGFLPFFSLLFPFRL